MRRHEFEKIITESGFQKGGTKEACLKVEEVLKNIRFSVPSFAVPENAVSTEEFVQAVKVLLAFAKSNEDHVPKMYCCSEDCECIFSSPCPGEENLVLSQDAKELCPYYCIEDK